MTHKPNKITASKWVIKAIFFSWLISLPLYALFNIKELDQSTIIDKTITYTTTTYIEDIPLNITPSPEEVVDSIPKYVIVPEGGVDWKLFAKTKSLPYSFIDEEGKELYGVQPEFSDDLQKLNGQKITMQGYMFPLNAAENQLMFIFGPFPVSCPYRYHVGPALVMEAHGLKEIEFKLEPITLEGRLILVPRDDEHNVFYRLKEARLIK